MQITVGVEQAIYIVVMLSTQKEGEPLKSHILSRNLEVSDSYLKKIVRKLVLAGIVSSSASKTGGISLKKEPEEISFLDLFNAIEGKKFFLKSHHLREKIRRAVEPRMARNILDPKILREGVDRVFSSFEEAQREYEKTLDKFKISELVKNESWDLKYIDWKV